MAFKNITVALTGNATSLRSSLAKASRDVATFDKTVQSSAASTGRASKAWGAAGLVLAGGLAMGLASAVKQAAAFDKSMRNVNSIARESEAEFAATSAAVLELSTRLPQTATVLAEGLYDIASSGFQGAEGLAVLEASATAAAAGVTDTAVAAQAITAVLNAYGLEAADAADVSDTLFSAVDVGVITFEELAGSLGNVVGFASAAGISIQEVSSALAGMTLAGIGAAEASTSLNRVIQTLVDPGDELTAQISQLGYESGLAMLETEGLHGSMELLRQATGGNVEALLELFPEIRAARGAFALMANEGENYARTAERIENATNRAGSTQAALNEQMKSLSLQYDLFKSSVSAAAITVGTGLIPVLISTITGVQDLAREMGGVLGPVVERMGPLFGHLGDLAGSLWDILVGVGNAVGPLVIGLGSLGAALAIDALTVFVDLLATTVGWLADNEAGMAILAGVAAASLAPALASVVGYLGAFVALRFEAAATAIVGGFRSITAAASAAGTAMTLATAGIAAVVAAGVWAVQRIGEHKRNIRDDVQEMRDAFGAGIDTSTMAGQIERLKVQHRELRDESNSMHDSLRTRWSDTRHAINVEAEGVEEALIHARRTAVHAIGAIHDELGVGLSLDAIYELADALGIDLTEATIDEALPALVNLADEIYEGNDAIGSMTGELDDLITAQQAATDAHKEFTDQLRAQADPVFAAQKAAQDYADALEDLRQTNRDDEATAREQAEARREVAAAMLDLQGALGDLRTETGELITSEQQLRDFFGALDVPQEVIDQIVADFDLVAGLSDDYQNKTPTMMLDADGKPAFRELDGVEQRAQEFATRDIVPEVGLDSSPFTNAANQVDGWMTGFEQSNPETDINADPSPAVSGFRTTTALGNVWGLSTFTGTVAADTAPARTALDSLRTWVQGILENPWVVRIRGVVESFTGDGPGRGGGTGAALRAVESQMSGLPGLRVTSTYRTPARNAAVGGSPNSYHLDPNNPAVDVAGPMGSLDRLYSRLREMPHRELLWRTTGHYDHLHFAKDGAYWPGAGREQHVAQIAKPGDWRVWAEPETGGEAYIPLAQSKRGRSTDILSTVARQFGYGLAPMAAGGVLPGSGSAVRSGPTTPPIEQHFHGNDARTMAYEARHQAKLLLAEVGT